MKNFIFLEKFNNYYNRKVKYYASLVDYYKYEHAILEARNFVYNNGVNTTAVVNWKDEWSPDYLLVIDELGEIHSRWFILSTNRILNGQFSVKLRRDLIADYYEKLQDVPMFVQKGNLDASNPLIFNNEAGTYNQIKRSETLLRDESETAWIVGYLEKGFSFKDTNNTATDKTISIDPRRGTIPILENLGIQFTDPLSPQLGGNIRHVVKGYINGVYQKVGSKQVIQLNYDISNGATNYTSEAILSSSDARTIFKFGSENLSQSTVGKTWSGLISSTYKSATKTGFENFAGVGYVPLEEFQSVVELQNKMVYSTITDKYYTLRLRNYVINKTSSSETLTDANPNHVSLLSIALASKGETVSILSPKIVGANGNFTAKFQYNGYEVYLMEAPREELIQVNFRKERKTTSDAPYDIFAIPFSEDNLALATELVQEATTKAVYDLQILPYCPAREFMTEDGIVLTGTEGVDYYEITQDGNRISYLLWSDVSSGSFIINSPIGLESTNRGLKIQNETQLVRLCSPNYNGSFDFSAAKNGGVDFFKVSYTYKPYSPFVQVAPNFKNLYGGDFSDARGLICNGDFSIATTSDAWKQYELSNKNYQNIFNTQIKTMDENFRLQRQQGAIEMGINAAGAGLAAGAFTGNPLVGIGVGVASAAGGAADMFYQKSMYQNNRSSQIDLFKLQLGNVRAIPDSLNKISAYNINNKYFPFVEVYTATDEEKAILELKLKYEGMTVNSISTMRNFEDIETDFNYFKAQLIMNQEIAENFEILDNIGYELERGIYL